MLVKCLVVELMSMVQMPTGAAADVMLHQELKYSRRAPGYFTRIGDDAPPAECDSSEVACA